MAFLFAVGIIRNVNTQCGQSAELLVLERVVHIVASVLGKCAKACDLQVIYFWMRVCIGCKGIRGGTVDVSSTSEYGN